MNLVCRAQRTNFGAVFIPKEGSMGKGSRLYVVAEGFSPEQLSTVLNTWVIMMLGTIREIELVLEASDVSPAIKAVLATYFEEGHHIDMLCSHSITLTTLPDGSKKIAIAWLR